MLLLCRGVGLRSFAIRLFGGLPIDIVVGSWICLIAIVIWYLLDPTPPLTTMSQVIFVLCVTVGFGLYFFLLRDHLVHAAGNIVFTVASKLVRWIR